MLLIKELHISLEAEEILSLIFYFDQTVKRKTVA